MTTKPKTKAQQRKENRDKQFAKLNLPKTTAGLLARWKRNLEPIRTRATNLWADRLDFNEFRDIVLANPKLDKTAGFFDLVRRMYLSHVLVAIRTFDDSDLRSNSLYNLIEEIYRNASLLTEEWFVGRFRGKEKRFIGSYQFREQWNGSTHISKGQVLSDLRTLRRLCEKVRQAVNKHIAHSAKRKPLKPLMYDDVNKAIDGIYALISKYNALIFNSAWGEPMIQHSSHIFTKAWIPDTTGS